MQPFFVLLGFIDINRQAVPLDDASLLIAQRLATCMVPTKLAVRPTETVHNLEVSSGLNRVRNSLCSFWKVLRVEERLPTTLSEILKSRTEIIQKVPIELRRFEGGVR